MPGIDWEKGIKIPDGLPDGEIERWNKIQRGEITPQPVATELGLELPTNAPEISNDKPKPEIDRSN